ncbi:hypothetical protein ACIRFH_19010 [Streptomyces sp. NPDC093586]|uniref:hypothetical protein n=1 Tax=Streptomyces sp. NPDC093586 TaxID=3366042 RepID=UPI0038002432
MAEPGDLPDGRLLLVEHGWCDLGPLGAERAARVPDVAEAQSGLDQDQAVGVGLDQQAVVHGRCGLRAVVGGFDRPNRSAVQVMGLHDDWAAT